MFTIKFTFLIIPICTFIFGWFGPLPNVMEISTQRNFPCIRLLLCTTYRLSSSPYCCINFFNDVTHLSIRQCVVCLTKRVNHLRVTKTYIVQLCNGQLISYVHVHTNPLKTLISLYIRSFIYTVVYVTVAMKTKVKDSFLKCCVCYSSYENKSKEFHF